MTIDHRLFYWLLVGAFGTAILGFLLRGLSTVVVGSETAQMVAAPVFVVAVGLAVVAFVLSVLVKLGVVEDGITEGSERPVDS